MTVFLLELRNIRKSTLIWTLSVSAVILLLLAFFPAMQSEAMQALTHAKLDSIDPAVLAVMGITEIPDFTKVTHFFGYVLQFITLALMVYMTQQAVTLLAKEQTEGTIEYLYAKPVSRLDILVQKALAHLVVIGFMLLVFVGVTTLGYLAFTDFAFGEALKEALIFYGAILFVGLLFSALGLLASALVRSSRSAVGVTMALVFGTFVLGATSALVKQLDFLIYLSPMDWIKGEKLMSAGIRPWEWVIGIALILFCPVLAWVRYRDKDLLIY